MDEKLQEKVLKYAIARKKIINEKIQVWAWITKPKPPGQKIFGEYHPVWGGKSLIKAIYYAWVAKAYSGCVKIEWRGTRWRKKTGTG